MAQLSSVAGIPIGTIKFYLREGLLPAGERTSPNQADYDERHLRRLRLIRGLIEVGRLSIVEARRVVDAIDSDIGLAETFEVAQHTVSEQVDAVDLDRGALDLVDAAMTGWRVSEDNPGRLAAARVIGTFLAIGQPDERGWLARYAEAALLAADADLDEIESRPDREAQAETVIVGTVLGDALFAALRRAAQEHATSLRYGTESDGAG
ncbi:MAG: hypothetical protein RI885_2729 [Actinomycetota bacterium]